MRDVLCIIHTKTRFLKNEKSFKSEIFIPLHLYANSSGLFILVHLETPCMAFIVRKDKKLSSCVINSLQKHQGASGVEPETSRSAVECSATELYPRSALASNQHFAKRSHYY